LALDRIAGGDYDLIVLPIKVGGHEGAPARAVLRKATRNGGIPVV
jgi:kynurenine formamidase